MTPRERCRGQGMVEYVLIVSLLAILVISIALYVFPPIRNIYRDALAPETMGNAQATVSAGLY